MDNLSDIKHQFPATQQEFERLFPSEEACVDYLTRLRWPDGPHCPKCLGKKLWRTGHRLICSSCRHQVRVMAGTIFQDSHQPLMIWFRAMWFAVGQKFGTNALGLHRTLGIGYESAWTVLRKLRRAMARPGRELLSGVVEVDEAYIGGIEEGSPGRRPGKKALVVIGVELKGKSIGRVRMRTVGSATAENLIGFVEEQVEPGSTVITGGWSSCSKLSEHGYLHKIGKAAEGHEELPHVHRVISLLKRWLLGTFQGAGPKKYLDFYLDEFSFRLNTSRSRGKLFLRLMEQAVMTAPATCEKLAGPAPEGRAE